MSVFHEATSLADIPSNSSSASLRRPSLAYPFSMTLWVMTLGLGLTVQFKKVKGHREEARTVPAPQPQMLPPDQAAAAGQGQGRSGLLAAEIPDAHDLSSGVLCQGWKIDTKYYSADLSIWTANLGEEFSLGSLPHLDQLAALVMVFDMSDESSLLTLQSWAANVDMQRFEILLCIGNKADLVPGHGAHVEYRRRMQRLGESSSDPHPEYLDFGINESEGFGLLSEEEPCIEIRYSTSQWCIEQNIEYIEACASNTDFDKCLSVDGDSQGLERLFGALSAHMWPGMILKSGNRITAPSLVEKEESTDDESNYDFEYEVLSHGSDDQWEFVGETSTSRSFDRSNEANGTQDPTYQVGNRSADSSASNALPSGTPAEIVEENTVTLSNKADDSDHVDTTTADSADNHEGDFPEANKLFEDEHYGLDDLEKLVSEIGNMRSNLRLMPDFQRREMAAKLAMKMATMFERLPETVAMASPPHFGIRRRFALLASATLAILILCGTCSCLQFSYPTFDAANEADFSFSPGSGIANGALQITPTTGDIRHRSGRVCYARETLKLWNSERTALTSFRTEFVLNILPRNGTGEGMAFILTNNPALPPGNSSGQWLGVTSDQTDGSPANRVVAVEFDTRKSGKDDLDHNHVGLDVNSIRSVSAYPLGNLSIVLSSGSDVSVSIQYDGAVLSIVAVQTYSFVYSWAGDLSQYLTEDITVGFAASTGEFTELNQIKSWNFTTLGDADDRRGRQARKLRLLLAYLIPFAIVGLFLALCVWRRLTRPRRLAYRNLEKMIDARGPVRFGFRELRNATANFSSDRKLGRGGFGTVYLGYLKRMGMEVAVKRVMTSDNSSRGEQEFVAEVNSISKLSHRNLVKLIGWCHERGELLLVYEYFPMGSLDKLLYADAARASSGASASETTAAAAPELTWERRYRIICGVASALDYLHHGSSKRILHRDVKASNVMLDGEYGARLGDFGLARVVQRDGATHHSTQAVAGTRAYMAYESFFTGRASLDTDAYAFGVFVLEVVSGRRPSSPVPYSSYLDDVGGDRDRDDVVPGVRWRGRQDAYIVDWAWRLYGEGRAWRAADAALDGAFDPAEADRAVRLALACCHPNPRERPSMRAAVQVLAGAAQAPEPSLVKPAFVWPPDGGGRQEIEMERVGLLFTGAHSSFCSMTSSSISGR
ncbi:putative L-type lectin-domain containing receptor kinase S.5 [Dichanthelium oligosanthes]|uniref:non-specific serine/threonine protein kinase n=1 Tax=Dichanthelium oligosanthes TaxID=888268 RepID=A0A1E5UJ56_9POAL|nr:putative L-type lectin-domain containing receptor kinase S.5 [Dichanthelium oligosanthes]